MASNEDKCIGRLTLDISDINQKLEFVKEKFQELNTGKINISSKNTAAVREALKEITELVQQSEKQISEYAKKIVQEIESTGKAKVGDQTGLKEATAALKEYYSLMTKMQNAANSGKSNMADYYKQEAEAVLKKVGALREEAEAQESVIKAKRAYEASVMAGADKQAAQEAKEAAKAQKELEASIRERAKAQELASRTKNTSDPNSEANILHKLIELYRKKAVMETEATRAMAAGVTENINLYLQEEAAIDRTIEALRKSYNESNSDGKKKTFEELEEEAVARERVTQAELKRQAVVNSTSKKSEDLDYKNRTEAINEYAVALENLYNEQAKMNNQLASREITEDSVRYQEYQQSLRILEEQVEKTGNRLKAMGVDADQAVEGMKRVRDAAQSVVDSERRLESSDLANYLGQIKQKYFDLTDAIKNYDAAQKSGDKQGMATWQAQIDATMREVGAIQEVVSNLNIEKSVKQQILNTIEQCVTAEHQHSAAADSTAKAASAINGQITGILTRMFSLMAIIRTIKNLFSNMIDYVSEYSAKMNEIQMITLKNSTEVAQMGETYREIAKEMAASSLDIADAAIYFTRQGLKADEVEERIRNTTRYAKAANIEFETAAELITAVVNSMGLLEQEEEDGRAAAQRVADVFLKVGDNAATSGKEIGEAMQKAAASAGTFGMSFEWLATYIATVSETTRQEARTIGTAFNTIIARLHQIKQKGYNEEDETKINDIAKALSNIGVTLMDNNNEWRDMDVIFQEIGAKWSTLDDKTKSYIATTMAGVKQQNVFLALMNDLGKQINDNSRAFELYEMAVNSAGTAEKKYAVYTDSVAASQERLNVAKEHFNSTLDENLIKGWNNAFAGWVDNLAVASERTNGLVITIPVLVGAMGALAFAITEAGGASAFFASVWESHPILLVISAIAAATVLLVSTVSSAIAAIETMEEKFKRFDDEFQKRRARAESHIDMQTKINQMLEELDHTTEPANEVLDKYGNLLDEVAEISPKAAEAVKKLRDEMTGQTGAAKDLNTELQNLITTEQGLSMTSLAEKYKNYDKTGALPGGNTALDTIKSMISAISISDSDMAYYFSDPKNLKNFIRYNAGKYASMGNQAQIYLGSSAITSYKNDRKRELEKEGFNEEAIWNTIAQEVWDKFLFGSNVKNGTKYLQDEVNSMFEEVISAVTYGKDETTSGILYQRLRNLLFGEDGQVDPHEWFTAGEKISDFLTDIINNGVQISPEDILSYIGDRVFSGNFADAFAEQIESLKDSSDFPEMVQAISDVYSELLRLGFSDFDIYDLFNNITDLADWDKALGIMSDKLKEKIRQANPEGFLQDVFINEDGSITTKNYLDELDLSTLKLIDDLVAGGTTYGEINELFMESGEDIEVFIAKLQELSLAQQNQTESTEEEIQSLSDTIKALKNLEKELDTLQGYIDTLEKGEKLSYTDLLDLAGSHPEIMQLINDTDALIAALKRIKEETAQKDREKNKESLIKAMMESTEFMALSPFAGNYDTLQDYVNSLDEGSEELAAVSEYTDQCAEALLGASESMEESAENMKSAAQQWLEAQMEIIKANDQLNWAKSNSFIEQIGEMKRAIESGGAEEAYKIWSEYSEDMREAIADTYPDLIAAMYEIGEAMEDTSEEGKDLTDSTNKLSKALEKSAKYATVKHFTNTYDAIRKLEKGTISATDAYETFNKELDKVVKAGEDIDDVNKKMAEGTEVTASDVSNLSSLLGESADTILQDWDGAVKVFDDMTSEAGALKEVFDALNQAAFIRITGVSEADFSNLENGLFAVRSDAEEVIELLKATGQWELEDVALPQEAKVWDPFSRTWEDYSTVGHATVLKATGNNPYKRSPQRGHGADDDKTTGGGGGGGGKNKNQSQMTEVERMLDRMSQTNAIQEYQQGWYGAQKDYYNQTGQLQGVIAYTIKDKEALEEQNKTLEANVEWIEKMMDVKKKELDALSTSDEQYEEVSDDLDKLQQAHQDYTQALIENKTAVDADVKAIKELNDKIRSMEIDLRDTILEAIEDREKKKEDMFNAEIEMENKILDVIKHRYEVERDKIIDNAEKQKELLEEQKDLLTEQLNIRKEMAEEDEKAEKLQKLELQYQRIVADPTRQKEALKIQDQIKDLRKEIAWDAAESEVKAQQDSLDQQINSLDDYINYVKEYYDDLFKHPDKLIEEMKRVMKQSSSEIIDWLKENDETYGQSTENAQKKMEQDWKQTLDDMHGMIKTHWGEVEKIIAGGDDAIIDFLKKNSSKYAEAGKLQADAYVDEWKKKLEDLKKAYEPVQAMIAPNYHVIEKPEGEGGSSGGGGGGSGSSKTGGGNDKADEKSGSGNYMITYLGGDGANPGSTRTAVVSAKDAADAKTKFMRDHPGVTVVNMSATDQPVTGASDISSQEISWDREKKHNELQEKINELDVEISRANDDLSYWGKMYSIERRAGNEEKRLRALNNETAARSTRDKLIEKQEALKKELESIPAYASGGMVDFTGPAWLDGSKQLPERILSPYQTELFETMVKALEKISTIPVSSMPNYGGLQNTGGNAISMGDIVVNVDNLDTDDDYEELARKVGEVLMDRIGRTTIVSGLRINSY